MNRIRSTNTAQCRALTLVATMLIVTPGFAGTVPSFQGLGDLPGGGFFSQAFGMSADGLVVVGQSSVGFTASDRETFRWTNGEGMVGLGDLNGFFDGNAYDVSADGSVVIGRINDASGSEAFRWTSGGWHGWPGRSAGRQLCKHRQGSVR